MAKNVWPLQSGCDAFYGNPRGRDGNVSPKWYAANIVKIAVPFKIKMGHIPITKVAIHRKCAESAARVLNRTWEKVGRDQATIDKLHVNDYAGSFNYRAIRGSNRLSMHAYGCAWDWDADENALGDRTPFFTKSHPFVIAHFEEGWVWGATWDRPDAMHFQAARIG